MSKGAFQHRLKMLAIVGFCVGLAAGYLLFGMANERHSRNLQDSATLKALKAAPHYEQAFEELASRWGAEVIEHRGEKAVVFHPPRLVYYLLLGGGGGSALGAVLSWLFFRCPRQKEDEDDFFLYPDEEDEDGLDEDDR